ncbi:Gaa1-domain-containing protein [Coprinellus micaceus]|uniref:Gaa1-domain-containing protein n=1 Tax=Coprinellus micaceus TaxID=71717 RepID=A0A4Y7SXP5_COPMI|nr:Gaa1-domain-containing protein [Coprinellus micaceus]
MDEGPPPAGRSWKNTLQKLRGRFKPEKNAAEVRVRRRRAMIQKLHQRLPFLKVLLFLVGYLWMVAIPYPDLGRTTYIDENALQPAQVSTYWDWADVHNADRYLDDLERLGDRNASSAELSEFVKTEFQKSGLPAATQKYTFSVGSTNVTGVNAYAVSSSPRASGNEAIVISASWIRRHEGGPTELNLRGVSAILALAKYLKGHSMWAKDLVFVVSDGYLDGMQAWLGSYHGSKQNNLQAEELLYASGVIWNALSIDYACHSFSHLGVFHEGLNGRLPNQDLINSFERISRFTGGVPVVLYDHAKNVVRHVGYQGPGRPSGIHGLFHPYRIDAFTIYAVCAQGPHGFHALGRVVESTLRTMNNLLERLHASFFFYILTDATYFNKIGSYLPSAILVSVGMMFHGLDIWVMSGWRLEEQPSEKVSSSSQERGWVSRQRPVLHALTIMMATHILGALVFGSLSLDNWQTLAPILFAVVAVVPLAALLLRSRHHSETAPVSTVLKALNLCFASTIISVISVLNFSLALLLAIALGIPLAISTPSSRLVQYPAYILLAAGWLLFLPEQTQSALWNWEVLSVWFAPVAAVVTLLPM